MRTQAVPRNAFISSLSSRLQRDFDCAALPRGTCRQISNTSVCWRTIPIQFNGLAGRNGGTAGPGDSAGGPCRAAPPRSRQGHRHQQPGADATVAFSGAMPPARVVEGVPARSAARPSVFMSTPYTAPTKGSRARTSYLAAPCYTATRASGKPASPGAGGNCQISNTCAPTWVMS